jgi:ribosomal protein S18 acetylase RimI-like enzyme
MSVAFDVLTIEESHWQQLRDLRLEMLADTPTAYLEELSAAQKNSEAEWRFRARRVSAPGHIGVAARTRDESPTGGRWIASMQGATFHDGRTFLLAVYVTPAFRGRAAGVADALLDRVEAWAAAEGARTLYLQVHEDNLRAQRFYVRRSYRFTGAREPYPLDRSRSELEMIKPL